MTDPDVLFDIEAMRKRGDVAGLISALNIDGTVSGIPVRKWAARALVKLGDPSAAVPMAALLRDTDTETRTAVAAGLGQLGNPAALTALIDVLRHDESPVVRQWAATSVGMLGGATGEQALRKAL